MWRFIGPGLCALLLGGCIDCDDLYHYRCVPRYDPYYGYYNYCYAARNQCGNRSRHCIGRDCNTDDSRVACKHDADCEPGQNCSSDGHCANGYLVDAGAAGSGTPGAAGHPASDAAQASSSDASTADAGSSGGSPSGTGATSGEGASTSSGGGTTSGSGGASSSGVSNEGGTSSVIANERLRRYGFPCVRDTQCGAGECSKGECFAACETDAECGTADRCSVESGRRLCMPDPNPVVRCDQSADCRSNQTCVDGTCHDPCDVDTDCADPQDRCLFNLCFADRRPIAECVLNLECTTGLVCLDGRCVDLDGG